MKYAKEFQRITSDLADHLAVRAWWKFQATCSVPDVVEVLKNRHQSKVYRLAGAGPGGSNVIAKWWAGENAEMERLMHEAILPRLPVPSLKYYGLLPEQDGKFCWTFIEDAGSECYLPEVPEHGILAAELLAAIHTSAAAVVPDLALADRGPNVYLDSLRAAGERIRRHLEEADLSEDERFTVAEISAQCDCLAACWNRVEVWIDGAPQTLVHGDCHPANLRMINTGKGPKLVLLDWDTAGVACPAIDLALIGLHQATYWSIVRAAWPNITIQTVHGMANAGRIFQLLAMIDCETRGMTYPWPQRLIKNLTFYRAELAEAIHLSGLNR